MSRMATKGTLQMRVWLCLAGMLLVNVVLGAEVSLNGHQFTLPAGLEVTHVAGQPMVERPVSADFDEKGRLYVTDSSGSNEPLQEQLKKLPHRIVRLEDTDSDGTFDRSTVFADRLMFPEGAMWYDGSLYVAAPPHIWKFTDADDDGVAEHREVWFDGKTVTHCGNDLHGPYLGPDGWIYWCKGAFAEQTYDQPGRAPLRTKASHIFRRRPEGGPIESVMAGGMDNPVELVFTPGGERIFSTTFLVHPNQGLRDGLLHAVYGGVYGKDHRVLDGHPRTGELMPVMTHMGVAAPCGLACLKSNALGPHSRGDVLACSFNMRKVTRHVLEPHGATFSTEDSTLLISDNLDFHPTDVLEDADGSIVVVDTGGWFRLCCPTSQLEKPDILGGIYRIRRTNADQTDDPRGRKIDWQARNDEQLASLLSDERFTVRDQAKQQLRKHGDRAVAALRGVVETSPDEQHRLQALWTLTTIDSDQARAAARLGLKDADPIVRQAAVHSVSVHRDHEATRDLASIISSANAHNRRAAAEALGRTGSPDHIATLLSAVPQAVIADSDEGNVTDRVLEHSLIYAAMELNDSTELQKLIHAQDTAVVRAALIALDQLDGGKHLHVDVIQPLLISSSQRLNDAAWWIAGHHPDWGDAIVEAFRQELKSGVTSREQRQRLANRLATFANSAAVQVLAAEHLQDESTDHELKLTLLAAMAESRQKPLPAVWRQPLQAQLTMDSDIVGAALQVLKQLSAPSNLELTRRLHDVSGQADRYSDEVRLAAIGLVPAGDRKLSADQFEFVCEQLSLTHAVSSRALAVDILTSTPLGPERLQRLAQQLPDTGVMELQPLLKVFASSRDSRVGRGLIAALLQSPAATSLFPDQLTKLVSGFDQDVRASARPLVDKIEQENRQKVERIEEILALLPDADVRRGLKVFQSPAASCIACHRRAYLGGHIGPDLSRIGQARSERDLLESILFPSLTFVRNYEPVSIVTSDGLVHSGVIREESDHELILQLDAKKSITIEKSDIEERFFSKTSIMPAGLDKQLSPQQLADLVKYLKED